MLEGLPSDFAGITGCQPPRVPVSPGSSASSMVMLSASLTHDNSHRSLGLISMSPRRHNTPSLVCFEELVAFAGVQGALFPQHLCILSFGVQFLMWSRMSRRPQASAGVSLG